MFVILFLFPYVLYISKHHYRKFSLYLFFYSTYYLYLCILFFLVKKVHKLLCCTEDKTEQEKSFFSKMNISYFFCCCFVYERYEPSIFRMCIYYLILLSFTSNQCVSLSLTFVLCVCIKWNDVFAWKDHDKLNSAANGKHFV